MNQFSFSKISLKISLCCFIFSCAFSFANDNYLEILEKSVEVMSSQTMSYVHCIGQNKTKIMIYQKRELDGTVNQIRREVRENMPISQTQLKPGEFLMERYYTNEGSTEVFLTQTKTYGIRVKESIPRPTIYHEKQQISGKSVSYNSMECWKITEKYIANNGEKCTDEFLIEKKNFAMIRNQLYDSQGKLLSTFENRDFNFSPDLSQIDFSVPPDLDLRYAKDLFDSIAVRQKIFKAIAQDIENARNSTPKEFQYSSRRGKRLLFRCLIGVALALAGISFGTAAILKRREKKQ